jgi:hypothetical protein
MDRRLERSREETRGVKHAVAFRQPENLLRDFAAKIRAHRDTRKVVFRAVPDTLVASQMRHHVESTSAAAGPQMAKADVGKVPICWPPSGRLACLS